MKIGGGSSIDTTAAQCVLVFHNFSALAESERDLVRARSGEGRACRDARQGADSDAPEAQGNCAARPQGLAAEHSAPC